jgi:ECF sigma factor
MDLQGLAGTDRVHFFSGTAEMRRRNWVDQASKQNRLKRGGDAQRVTLLEAASLVTEGRRAKTWLYSELHGEQILG